MASPLAIALAAYDAGLRSPAALTQATAIAMAESGGNERAHNRIPPDDSYGLWQINMYGSMGPARREQFKLTSNEQLYDVATNAAAMAAISATGTNWKPWSTFQGPAYTLFYPAAAAAATAALAARGASNAAGAAVQPVTDVVGAAVEAVGFAQRTAAWLANRNNWVRVAKVGMGAALVIAGAALLVRPDRVIETLTRPVKGIL